MSEEPVNPDEIISGEEDFKERTMRSKSISLKRESVSSKARK